VHGGDPRLPKSRPLYRIFVASPSDCRKERQLIRELVADWNTVHGLARGLFLEPVLWETHAQPELDDCPQALINRQLIASCDALIRDIAELSEIQQQYSDWGLIGAPQSSLEQYQLWKYDRISCPALITRGNNGGIPSKS